jgi:hypothetical protein
MLYNLPESELHDLAYIFDAPHAGIDEAAADRLRLAVAQWSNRHESSRLTHHDLGSQIVLVNQRAGFGWTTLSITDPVEVAAFHLLEDPRSVQSLTRRLGARFDTGVSGTRVADLLAE